MNLAVLLAVVLLGGCQNQVDRGSKLDDSQREYILSKVNNYNGLIKLYREKLRRKEEKETRYRLAEYYHMAEDFDSSRQYLQPLLASEPDERVLVLESKNLMDQGRLTQAQEIISRVVVQNTKSGEAWNMQGVLLAQNGDHIGAARAFNNARQHFVDDDIVINNLAMLAIMKEDYAVARDYLLSLYSRGHASQKVLHNLVYVLVKLHDFSGAESILQQEKMSGYTEGLVEALAKVNPRPHKKPVQKPVHGEVLSLKQGAQCNVPRPVIQTPVPVSTKDETARRLESQRSPNKPAGIPETASLPLTRGLKDVSAVRSGEYPGYFRMTLESHQAINYRQLTSAHKNKRLFELYNVRLGNALLIAASDISKKYHNVKQLSFYQNQPDTVLIEFEFIHSLAKTKVFRLSVNEDTRERLVFDIYYG